jgi:hypothetical protein
MSSKNNRLNHDFQIAYFLAGSCHTPDAAYSLLKDLQEEREMALAQIEGSELRAKAKILRAEKMIQSDDPATVLEGQAELADMKNNEHFLRKNIEAAKRELNFIQKCIDRLYPYRKYSHLPDEEAHEAIQMEEWKLELINRAENNLLASGQISSDLLQTMRQHPQFQSDILPAIENIKLVMTTNDNFLNIVEKLGNNKLDIPKLLEVK